MYDTGDFIDDYAIDPILRNDLSFLFSLTISKQTIRSVTLIPIKIGNVQVNLAQGEDKKLMIERMKKLSAHFGTGFKEANGTLVLHL